MNPSCRKVKYQLGAAMVEFAIVLSLILLPFSVAMANLGRLIAQVQLLSDYAREAARAGAIMSYRNVTLPCADYGGVDDGNPNNDIISIATQSAKQAIEADTAWGAKNVWYPYVTTSGQRIFRANDTTTSAPKSYLRPITVNFITDPDATCLFCIEGNILQSFDIWIWATMDLNDLSYCTRGL